VPRHDLYAIDVDQEKNCYSYGVLVISQQTVRIEE